MPTFAEHITKAKHNEEFAVYLRRSSDKFCDWLVSGYFYAAVHYIESYFDRFHAFHFTDHAKRLSQIHRTSSLNAVYSSFRSLQDDSEEARYGVTTFTLEDIDKHILPRFDRIKSHLKSKSSDYSAI